MKVTEIFESLQGEGIYLGCPSVFLRLFGCNFTCPGFSNPSGEAIEQPDVTVKSVKELDGNAFTKGCDSRYSWDKAFVGLTTNYTVEELADELLTYKSHHLVITGGEPMLHQRQLARLVTLLAERRQYTHLTFETNCSIPVLYELRMALLQWGAKGKRILFSNSPKLKVSGEPESKRINPIVTKSQVMPNATSVCKYVVSNKADVLEALEMHKRINPTLEVELLLMPMGATVEQYNETLIVIAELAVKYKCRLTPRLHLNIWGNKVGT